MRLTYLAYSFSLTIMYFSFVLLLPVLVALYFHETNAILPFLLTGAFALMISVTIRKLVSGAAKIKSINDIKKSEGLCVVTFSWLFAAILAAIPYTFFGIKPVSGDRTHYQRRGVFNWLKSDTKIRKRPQCGRLYELKFRNYFAISLTTANAFKVLGNPI